MFRTKVAFQMTFDRDVIKSNWTKFNKHPLSKAGLLVRKIARNSIRRRKNRNKYSPVGTPPFSHVQGAHPPFKLIYSVPSFGQTRVYVGMVGFGGGTPVPGLHEHGGFARRRIFKVVGRRKLVRNFKQQGTRGADGRYRDKRGRFVRTATRTKGGLGGAITKRVSEVVRYPKRPFMVPALLKGTPALPQLWANSIYGSKIA